MTQSRVFGKSASVGRKSGAYSATSKARITPSMPDHRRNRVPGGTFFFTINLLDRRPDLLGAQIDILREAVARARANAPFRIDAWLAFPII
jgi:hypothetical protein